MLKKYSRKFINFIYLCIALSLLFSCPQITNSPANNSISFDENTIIYPGIGINEIKVSEPSSKVEQIFGPCDDKTVYGSYTRWNYNKYNIDFLIRDSNGLISEIRFNTGFPGKTTNNISLSSTLSDVKTIYPGYNVSNISSTSDWTAGNNNVLYIINDGINPVYYRFSQTNILYWFNNSENSTQIVVF